MKRYVVGKASVDVFVFVDLKNKTIERVVVDDSFDEKVMDLSYADEDMVLIIDNTPVTDDQRIAYTEVVTTQDWPAWELGF